MHPELRKRCVALGLALALAAPAMAQAGNPLLPSGPDPWVAQKDGFYYYTNTLGDRIDLWKTADMRKLGEAERVTVWRAPASGPHSFSIWAPELHFLDGKWYLYYSASERGHDDDSHRHVFVLENASADPTKGTWVDKGMLKTGYNGIDGTVFDHGGKRYFVYSAYVGDHSDLVIAPMTNPWTLSDKQVDIAAPTFDWEMQGGRKILEGPEFLAGPSGKVFLTYSASACWSDGYSLGLLTADAKGDLTDPASWTKSPKQKFASANGVYAPGHNGFFQTPDGRHWLIYHANGGPDWKCTKRRAPRIQPFDFGPDGTPQFGAPVPDTKKTAIPPPP